MLTNESEAKLLPLVSGYLSSSLFTFIFDLHSYLVLIYYYYYYEVLCGMAHPPVLFPSVALSLSLFSSRLDSFQVFWFPVNQNRFDSFLSFLAASLDLRSHRLIPPMDFPTMSTC